MEWAQGNKAESFILPALPVSRVTTHNNNLLWVTSVDPTCSRWDVPQGLVLLQRHLHCSGDKLQHGNRFVSRLSAVYQQSVRASGCTGDVSWSRSEVSLWQEWKYIWLNICWKDETDLTSGHGPDDGPEQSVTPLYLLYNINVICFNLTIWFSCWDLLIAVDMRSLKEYLNLHLLFQILYRLNHFLNIRNSCCSRQNHCKYWG